MQNRPLATTLGFIGFLAVLFFRVSHPVNEETAVEWIEQQGYTDVHVEDTDKKCYPSFSDTRWKFNFTAINIDGDNISGTLCFTVNRLNSTLREH